ncbi:hypothetical protein PR048_004971 [Dryococelus australis]|uniref:DUF7869 domain-containing protein n=1 Tax=Dryococelus australis TaxID=614101 RepID=A0ABQ9I6X8_9NEOP|nr:hypothetical protein PR048_004971 [Dryococelus australis]
MTIQAPVRRKLLYLMLFLMETKNVLVCSKTFKDIFGLTPHTLQTLQTKRKAGTVFTENDLNLIRAHIMPFPWHESHYSHKKSTPEFLSADLNMNHLFRAFKEKHQHSQILYRYYSSVFSRIFPNLNSLSLLWIRAINATITCSTTKNGKAEVSTNLEQHHMKADKIALLCMDLQKVVFVSILTHSSICITPNIVTSGVIVKKKLVIWCNICAAQNKNRILLMAIIYLVSKEFFESVELKYLVSGHSFTDCDHDFKVIEKRCKVSKPIVPKELEDMKSARINTPPLQVIPMATDDFIDFALLGSQYINTQSLVIIKTSHIKVEKKKPCIVNITNTFVFEEPSWTKSNVLKKRVSLNLLPA